MFRDAASTLGFRFVPGNLMSPPRILGDLDGMTAFAGRTSMRDTITRYTVNGMSLRYSLPVKGKLFIVTRNSIAPLRSLGPDLAEVPTGDGDFDSAMRTGCTGGPEHAAALLNAEVRRAILELNGLAWHLRVSRESIHYYDRIGFADAASIVGGFRRMAVLAGLLFRDGETREMLARNVREGPLLPVRVRNLRILAERYPRDPEVAALLEECRRDGDGRVRAEAESLLKNRR
ncbi:MAG: hypothetical protein JXA20_19470 [Spirochaetes bacterium]|nr:hypothetical protein [Spirochaetota bacterium]